MNRDSSEKASDMSPNKIGRRSLLGMGVAGLAGSLAACAAGPQAQTAGASEHPARGPLEGKVVLITGATSGIGRAGAVQFGRACFTS